MFKKIILLFFFTFLFRLLCISQINYLKNDSNNYFKCTYANETPDSVKNVIIEVTKHLSKYIKTEVAINVRIEWTEMGTIIQASCGPQKYLKIPFKLNNNNPLFPIALAEKLLGNELNSWNEPDVLLKINKNIPWYLKTDGKTPKNKCDLYTILLHEFIHGIGLQSNLTVSENMGYINGTEIPYFFDSFLVDFKGNHICDNTIYESPSNKLYRALTNDSLYFYGPFSKSYSNNNKIKMYAPEEFNFGSSIYHLDYKTYPKGTPNSLLNYGKDLGESIHSIGNIGKGLLADLGWSDFVISISKIKDNEDITYSPTILCYLDSICNPQNLKLHYSLDNFMNEKTISFTKCDTESYYRATIPASDFERTISYFVSTTDTSNKNQFYCPFGAPQTFYSFKTGKDTIKPTIAFNKLESLTEDEDTIVFSASVTDNLGIDSVWLTYLINTSDTSKAKTLIFNKTTFNNYVCKLAIKDLLKENQNFFYKISAKDSSQNNNINNTNGIDYLDYFQLVVGPPKVTTESFIEDFESDISKNRFVLNGFYINKDVNLNSKSLQTAHPYPTAQISGKTIELTAMIKNPIEIRTTDAYLDFDEIVLLEPGEPQTKYGDYEFWDYVIIEGSKDKINWYAFEQKGYKTEENEDWLARFYSSEFEDNGRMSSNANASNDLYKHHKINLLGNKFLRKGDVVYIRFRVFSDAFVNGWGWTIDNINIQGTPTYSNYSNNNFNIKVSQSNTNNSINIYSTNKIKNIKLLSILGKVIENIAVDNTYDFNINLKNMKGVYFLSITFDDNRIYNQKIILIH